MIDIGVNGYIDVAEFKLWAGARGYDYSAKSDQQIEQAITIASADYIDTRYVFNGVKLDHAQPMGLPTDVVAVADISKAVCQAVWQQLNGALFVDPVTSTASGEVLMERKKLDVLETEVQYAEGTGSRLAINGVLIDSMLRPYVVGGAVMGIYRV